MWRPLPRPCFRSWHLELLNSTSYVAPSKSWSYSSRSISLFPSFLQKNATRATERLLRHTSTFPLRPLFNTKTTFRSPLVHLRHHFHGHPLSEGTTAGAFDPPPISVVGSEPGVDPVRDAHEFESLKANCHIDVIDYGQTQVKFQEFDNKNFLAWLQENGRKKEDWAKVRWINVKGIDWEIIKSLSLVYNLHPLALEDVLHARDYRSKVDYYQDQLFVKGYALLLNDGKAGANKPATVPDSATITREFKKADGTSVSLSAVKKLARAAHSIHTKERNLYMFMFRDGTLIVFHESLDSIRDGAIKERLRSAKTGLRGTPDASVLLQSLLDLMVDHAIQAVDAFQNQIFHLEKETLVHPRMEAAKALHVLAADLTLQKRSLTPLKSLVYGLRRYDLERCTALVASATGTPEPDVTNVKGYMSHQSKIYLADVHDHLEYVISSLETFETVTDNLISYSFNAVSYRTNETMRRLTLATVVFFPLTIITSYFGMNFEEMPSLQNSELLFWKIAVPAVMVTIVFVKWRDARRMERSLRQNMRLLIGQRHRKPRVPNPDS